MSDKLTATPKVKGLFRLSRDSFREHLFEREGREHGGEPSLCGRVYLFPPLSPPVMAQPGQRVEQCRECFSHA